MAELHDLTALEQGALIRSGEISPVELTEHYLDRAARLPQEYVDGAFAFRDPDAVRRRAREVAASGTWQLPAHIYLRTQGFVVRYDGSEADLTDKYLKLFLGWQPNAFTEASVGWSGQRHRDPLDGLPQEAMVERGLFAKVAYAIQF